MLLLLLLLLGDGSSLPGGNLGSVEDHNVALGVCHGGNFDVNSLDLKMLDGFHSYRGPRLYLLKPAEAAETRAMMVKSWNFILID